MEDKKITTPEVPVQEQYRKTHMPNSEADAIANEILIILSKKNVSSALAKEILDICISKIYSNSIIKI